MLLATRYFFAWKDNPEQIKILDTLSGKEDVVGLDFLESNDVYSFEAAINKTEQKDVKLTKDNCKDILDKDFSVYTRDGDETKKSFIVIFETKEKVDKYAYKRHNFAIVIKKDEELFIISNKEINLYGKYLREFYIEEDKLGNFVDAIVNADEYTRVPSSDGYKHDIITRSTWKITDKYISKIKEEDIGEDVGW